MCYSSVHITLIALLNWITVRGTATMCYSSVHSNTHGVQSGKVKHFAGANLHLAAVLGVGEGEKASPTVDILELRQHREHHITNPGPLGSRAHRCKDLTLESYYIASTRSAWVHALLLAQRHTSQTHDLLDSAKITHKTYKQAFLGKPLAPFSPCMGLPVSHHGNPPPPPPPHLLLLSLGIGSLRHQ